MAVLGPAEQERSRRAEDVRAALAQIRDLTDLGPDTIEGLRREGRRF